MSMKRVLFWGVVVVSAVRAVLRTGPVRRSSSAPQMVMSTPPRTTPSSSFSSSWFPTLPSFGGGDADLVIPPEYLRGRQLTEVLIESPSMNSRKISASMILDTTIENVWAILSDYDNLAVHVPNLVKSQTVPSPVKGGIRLFQEGAQKIVGFTFRASLVMDMVEEPEDTNRALRERNLRFTLVESQMFSAFDGVWKLRVHSRSRELDPATQQYIYKYRTQLTYSVFVKPRGPVPVAALEWRIREDIPINLMAVKIASERLAAQAGALPTNGIPREGGSGSGSEEQLLERQQGWSPDETLAAYITPPSRGLLGGAKNGLTKGKAKR